MKSRYFLLVALFAALTAGLTHTAAAQTATQSVTVTVQEINAISTAGAVTLTINTATAGSNPDAVTSSSTYNLTTNGTDKKITAGLDQDTPTGLVLTADMAAPSGASSQGEQSLSSTSVDLVSGVTQVRGSGLTITYGASAEVGVDPGNYAYTVTYTITNS